MKEFAEQFYKSKNWQKCRDGYIKSVSGLCEDCYEKGIVRAGVIVHHKQHLTINNIDNPDITLDWSNLRYLCRDCHAAQHKRTSGRRYEVNEDGTVTAKRDL